MSLLTEAYPSVFRLQPHLFPLFTLKGVNLALRTNVLMIAGVFFVLGLYAAERLRCGASRADPPEGVS